MEGFTMENLVTKKLYVQNHEDLDEFRSMVMLYQVRLYRTALILTRHPLDAKELIHKTYLHARQNFHQHEPGPNFGAWLSEILVNQFIKKIKFYERKNHD